MSKRRSTPVVGTIPGGRLVEEDRARTMINDEHDTNIEHDIDEQAAAWAARRLSGSFSRRDQAALDAWLAADARRKRAFDDYMGVADRASHAADLARDEAWAKPKPIERPRPLRKWLVAAPALAASFLAAFVFIFSMRTNPAEPARYATARGDSAEFTLEDGSVIALNTDTRLEVVMTRSRRSVVLERGEALFEVSKDANRPFVVEASGARATVLGTRFNVLANQNTATFSVLHGSVQVGLGGKGGSQEPVTLTAGHEVVYSGRGPRSKIRAFNPQSVTGWRTGVAHYENRPLSEVVTDLNRYFDRQLVLSDDSLASVPVTATFDLSDQRVAVRGLSVALSLRAEDRGTSEILLMPDE